MSFVFELVKYSAWINQQLCSFPVFHVAVENDPFSWKETNIGDKPIFIHFPLIMGAEEGYFLYFHHYPGKWSNLTNIFQGGWNHQLENYVFFPVEFSSIQFSWTMWNLLGAEERKFPIYDAVRAYRRMACICWGCLFVVFRPTVWL